MSTKTVAEKALIRPNTTVWSSHISPLARIGPLPENVRQVDRVEQATTALVVADDARSPRDVLDAHQDNMARPNTLWVAHPTANRADINRDTLWRPILVEYRIRPIGQVSLDEVWSAMRLRPNTHDTVQRWQRSLTRPVCACSQPRAQHHRLVVGRGKTAYVQNRPHKLAQRA